ncbi:MAG: TetR/AcrR family transcriptional regulator C-terminal domain-containing protein [Sphaerochaeta sp.]|nr:TetR/AcrR family transcriptional regulator C-terminal domain-containing protein [Sphaerochaeta sp.]
MAQMTKLALAQSLKQLMAERTLDKITVKEVVARCGVNRQTFYYHFRDIYHLLDWMFANEGQEFAKKYPDIHKADDGQTILRSLCTYLQDNRIVMLNIYNSLGRELLDRYLCRETVTLLTNSLQDRSDRAGVKAEQLAFLINFYKHAFVGATLDWFQTGMPGETEQIVAQFAPILKGTFDSAMKRMANS